MGQDPAAIERQIRESRARISGRIEVVQQRIANDVEGLRRDANQQSSEALDEIKGLLDLEQQTRAHPYTMLAGGLGVGVLLGMASESLTSGHDPQAPAKNTQNHQSNNSLFAGVLAGVLEVTSDTLRDEVGNLLRDGFSSFKSSMKESQGGKPTTEPYST